MTSTTGTTTYEYDAANRLTSVDGAPYTWDDRGNLVSDGTFTYAYNGAGRMVRAQSVDGDASTYAWDWASGLPEMLSESGNLYLVGHDTLGRRDGAAWACHHLPDALGSVRQATDATGAVTAAREWTPFGVEVGAGQAGLGYTREWFDGDAGLLYLRARWYAPGVGRFTRKDPFPGLRTQPFSLNPYPYVLANPVNATDPSGRYHKDLHYDVTRYWALNTARIYGLSYTAERLADLIATGDQHVDDSLALEATIGCRRCHFCPKGPTDLHIWEAIESGNPFLFGAALHQYQDFYAHWNEGYDERGHGGDSFRAGVAPFGSPRSPGGKSNRHPNLLADFFEGGHAWEPFWVRSPYPRHVREDVKEELLRRNPGINLNRLNDDDLIDLYLRKEPGRDLNWEQHVQERDHFGLDPDAYIEDSWRDRHTTAMSRIMIGQFMRRIAVNACAVAWEPPEDPEIKRLLTE